MQPSLAKAVIGAVLCLVLFGAGSAGAQSVTTADFVFAYNDNAQQLPAANALTPVIFNHNAQISGWIHPTSPPLPPATSPNPTTFVAMNTGLYLVNYHLEATVNSLAAVVDTFSARLLLTTGTPRVSSEVLGSQSTEVFTVGALSSEHRLMSRSALVFVNAGDVLQVEIASNEGIIPLAFDGIAATGIGTRPTSAAITIVRIQ